MMSFTLSQSQRSVRGIATISATIAATMVMQGSIVDVRALKLKPQGHAASPIWSCLSSMFSSSDASSGGRLSASDVEKLRSSPSSGKFSDKYILLEDYLGSGSSGEVHKCFLKADDSKKEYACKEINIDELLDILIKDCKKIYPKLEDMKARSWCFKRNTDMKGAVQKIIAQEKLWVDKLSPVKNVSDESLLSLADSNIITPIEWMVEDPGRYGDFPRSFYVVMEFFPGHELRHRIPLEQRGDGLPVQTVKEIMRKALTALKFLHEHGIMHRNLKPENIMINEHDDIRIIDFGLAMSFDVNGSPQANSLDGTPEYFSPELCRVAKGQCEYYGESCDVWAMGVVMYELLTGQDLYSFRDSDGKLRYGLDYIYDTIGSWVKAPVQNVQNHSGGADDILYKMLNKDARTRISAGNCLAHSFFTS